MNSLELATRLCRDLRVKDLSLLPADARLDLLDAINGAMQRMSLVVPSAQRKTQAVVAINAPESVTLTVTNGSSDITGHTFDTADIGKTIVVPGDGINNQVVSTTELLAPFSGTSGSVTATMYSDAVYIPSTVSELASTKIRILETDTDIDQLSIPWTDPWQDKSIGEPCNWWIEENIGFQAAAGSFLIRLDTLPGQAYRLQLSVLAHPNRLTFSDLLNPTDVPVKQEWIESYMLPLARHILSESPWWAGGTTKDVLGEFAQLVPATLGVNVNRVGTATGF